MPKMKTRRAVAARFSMTGTGKLKRRKMNLRHILEKKANKRKARAGKTAYAHAADQANILRCLPNG